MDAARVRRAIKRCQEHIGAAFKERGLEAPPFPPRYGLVDVKPWPEAALKHALWMCEEALGHLEAEKLDKAQRWLGFIQGVLWVTGAANLPTLRADNRRETETPRPLHVDVVDDTVMEATTVGPAAPSIPGWMARLKTRLIERTPKGEPPTRTGEPEWDRFCDQWQDGDELWRYASDQGPMAFRGGLVLLRRGEVVAEYMEMQS